MSAQRAAPGMHTDQRRPRTFPLPLRNPQPGYFPLHPRHHGCVRKQPLGCTVDHNASGARHTDYPCRPAGTPCWAYPQLSFEILGVFPSSPVIDAVHRRRVWGGGGKRRAHWPSRLSGTGTVVPSQLPTHTALYATPVSGSLVWMYSFWMPRSGMVRIRICTF